MSSSAILDDSKFNELWEGLSYKNRQKALKGTCRALGNIAKKKAIDNAKSAVLKKGTFNFNPALRKGFRVRVFRSAIGFNMTVAPAKKDQRRKGDNGNSGYYTNSRGARVPAEVLEWVAIGTDERNKGKRTGIKKRYSNVKGADRFNHSSPLLGRITGRAYRRGGASTGAVTNTGYMERTKSEMGTVLPGELESAVHNQVYKIAKKYGSA